MFLTAYSTHEHPTVDAIRANPDDDQSRLAFADWLDAQGESDWAAFIRIQCELASLLAREGRGHLRDHELGRLAGVAPSVMARRHDSRFAGNLVAPGLDPANVYAVTKSGVRVVWSRGLVFDLRGLACNLEAMPAAAVWPVGQVQVNGFSPERVESRWMGPGRRPTPADALGKWAWFRQPKQAGSRWRNAIPRMDTSRLPDVLFDELPPAGPPDRLFAIYETESAAWEAFGVASVGWWHKLHSPAVPQPAALSGRPRRRRRLRAGEAYVDLPIRAASTESDEWASP